MIKMEKLTAMLEAETAMQKAFAELNEKEQAVYKEVSGHASKGNKGGSWNLKKAEKYAKLTDKDSGVSRAKMRRAAHLASLHCLAAGHHFKAYNSHSKNNKMSDKHSERAIAYQDKAKAYADKTNMHKAIANEPAKKKITSKNISAKQKRLADQMVSDYSERERRFDPIKALRTQV